MTADAAMDDNGIAEIKKLWRLIATSSTSILELRAIWPGRSKPPVTEHFRAETYPTIDARKEAFERSALHHNAQGYNCYIVMNPIAPDFEGKAASDRDIAYRDLLLIDIDRAAKAKEPASDAEIEEARKLADDVEAYLSTRWDGQPIRVMSGNGHHIYLPLSDVPNSDAATRAIEQFLKTLAKKFNNAQVRIDTTVFNASRITKVIGTVARKGTEAPGRPYRMARLYEAA